MARLFNDANPEGLYVNSAPVTNYPFTLSCWFNTDDDTIREVLLSVVDKDVDSQMFELVLTGDLAGDNLRFIAYAGGAGAAATTTAGFTANTWHHALGVATNSTSRAVYLDNANSGASTVERAPTGLDRVAIGYAGDASPSKYFSGGVAEAAIWNIATLDAAERTALAKGYSPLLIRPQSLVFYTPSISTSDRDIKGGLALTSVGTPSVAAHPRVFYPTPQFWSIPTAAPPAGAIMNQFQFVNLGADLFNGALIG